MRVHYFLFILEHVCSISCSFLINENIEVITIFFFLFSDGCYVSMTVCMVVGFVWYSVFRKTIKKFHSLDVQWGMVDDFWTTELHERRCNTIAPRDCRRRHVVYYVLVMEIIRIEMLFIYNITCWYGKCYFTPKNCFRWHLKLIISIYM